VTIKLIYSNISSFKGDSMLTQDNFVGITLLCADIVFDRDLVEAESSLEIVRSAFSNNWQPHFDNLQTAINNNDIQKAQEICLSIRLQVKQTVDC
jgi:hypothetical protein